VPDEPYPGETVVSRAPKTWIAGQDCLLPNVSFCTLSTGDPLTSSECADRSRNAILGVGHMLNYLVFVCRKVEVVQDE